MDKPSEIKKLGLSPCRLRQKSHWAIRPFPKLLATKTWYIIINIWDIKWDIIRIKMSFAEKCNNFMLRGAPLLIAFISKVLSKHIMFNLQKRS